MCGWAVVEVKGLTKTKLMLTHLKNIVGFEIEDEAELGNTIGK